MPYGSLSPTTTTVRWLWSKLVKRGALSNPSFSRIRVTELTRLPSGLLTKLITVMEPERG